jgi:hypothetical protein
MLPKQKFTKLGKECSEEKPALKETNPSEFSFKIEEAINSILHFHKEIYLEEVITDFYMQGLSFIGENFILLLFEKEKAKGNCDIIKEEDKIKIISKKGTDNG